MEEQKVLQEDELQTKGMGKEVRRYGVFIAELVQFGWCGRHVIGNVLIHLCAESNKGKVVEGTEREKRYEILGWLEFTEFDI